MKRQTVCFAACIASSLAFAQVEVETATETPVDDSTVMEAGERLPDLLSVDVQVPWSASVLPLEEGGSILAAMSHSEDYFELWRITPERTGELLVKEENVGYHPDAIYWVDWRDSGGEEPVLLLVVEGEEEIQLWRWRDQELQKEASVATEHPPRDVGIGDIDGDGLTDMVIGPYDDDPLQVLRSKGDFTFDSLLLDVTGVALHPRMVDWNLDGITDIVWSGYENGRVQVALQRPPGQDEEDDSSTGIQDDDTQPRAGPSEAEPTATEGEVASPDAERRRPTVFDIRNLWPVDGEETQTRPRVVVPADLNGDDAPDLVVATELGEGALVVFNDGEGGPGRAVRIPAESDGYNWAAVHGIGEDQLIALSDINGIVLVKREDDQWIRRSIAMENYPLILDLRFHDADGDDHLDLVFAEASEDRVTVVFGPLWERAVPVDGVAEAPADDS